MAQDEPLFPSTYASDALSIYFPLFHNIILLAFLRCATRAFELKPFQLTNLTLMNQILCGSPPMPTNLNFNLSPDSPFVIVDRSPEEVTQCTCWFDQLWPSDVDQNRLSVQAAEWSGLLRTHNRSPCVSAFNPLTSAPSTCQLVSSLSANNFSAAHQAFPLVQTTDQPAKLAALADKPNPHDIPPSHLRNTRPRKSLSRRSAAWCQLPSGRCHSHTPERE